MATLYGIQIIVSVHRFSITRLCWFTEPAVVDTLPLYQRGTAVNSRKQTNPTQQFHPFMAAEFTVQIITERVPLTEKSAILEAARSECSWDAIEPPPRDESSWVDMLNKFACRSSATAAYERSESHKRGMDIQLLFQRKAETKDLRTAQH